MRRQKVQYRAMELGAGMKQSLRMMFTLTAFACASLAHAQAYPTKSINLVVGFPPGGTVDVIARQLGDMLSKRLGQQIIVENRPGAAGNIAVNYTASSAPDGYTLLVGNTGMLAANPFLYPENTVSKPKVLVPIARFAVTSLVAAVPASLPVTTMSQFVQLARTMPDTLFYGSGGTGNLNQLAVESLKQSQNIKLTHVSYKGAAPSVTALAAGEVQFVIDSYSVVQPMIASGRVRALAVTSEERLKSAQDIPTMAEAGLPDMTMYGWQGLFVPEGTPGNVIERLSQAIKEVVAAPQLVANFEKQGVVASFQDAATFSAYIEAEKKHWGTVIRAGRIKIE